MPAFFVDFNYEKFFLTFFHTFVNFLSTGRKCLETKERQLRWLHMHEIKNTLISCIPASKQEKGQFTREPISYLISTLFIFLAKTANLHEFYYRLVRQIKKMTWEFIYKRHNIYSRTRPNLMRIITLKFVQQHHDCKIVYYSIWNNCISENFYNFHWKYAASQILINASSLSKNRDQNLSIFLAYTESFQTKIAGLEPTYNSPKNYNRIQVSNLKSYFSHPPN